ncbi:MAG: asparagine synthase B [Pirellulales bacterium]|nr:asparagine synthase B [Pirellulales bacterium]
MCGFLAILQADSTFSVGGHAPRAELLLDRLEHRGPDARGVWQGTASWLGHRRLAIVSPEDGAQPYEFDGLAWVTNSEIYNHHQLRQQTGVEGLSPCDSAIFGPAWQAYGTDLPRHLDGQFAFVIVDEQQGAWIAARDPIGICPLYLGRHADGSLWFASEMKALVDDCDSVEIVPPGHAWIYDEHGLRREKWYDPAWQQPGYIPQQTVDEEAVRETLIKAVTKRLMCDVPCGLLLSGGLDSSLIASIAVRLGPQASGLRSFSDKFHTFSIGLPGSPDLLAARRMAEFLGTIHHEFHFTVEEALAEVPSVVRHLESFEQIRTAVPTKILARKVRECGIKMVLSGEGADELLGGYLYFHKAPSGKEMQEELVRKVTRLHQFDVMRANKAPMAHGLEVRFPFLDQAFVDLVMDIDPREKMCDMDQTPDGRHPRMEKYFLRAAFDDDRQPWLPEETLWRPKEQFSDGVGYDWVDKLREHAATTISQQDWDARTERFADAPPTTHEQFWMRELFEEFFVSGRTAGSSASATVPRGRSIACSTPEALSWDESWQTASGDISGRAISGIHPAASGFSMERVQASHA